MIQIHITMTGKGFSSKDKFSGISEETKTFRDMPACHEYLKKTYGKCKRDPMYADGQDDKPIKRGYIYCFRTADYSHAPVQHWIQQDWVSFYELMPMTMR